MKSYKSEYHANGCFGMGLLLVIFVAIAMSLTGCEDAEVTKARIEANKEIRIAEIHADVQEEYLESGQRPIYYDAHGMEVDQHYTGHRFDSYGQPVGGHSMVPYVIAGAMTGYVASKFVSSYSPSKKGNKYYGKNGSEISKSEYMRRLEQSKRDRQAHLNNERKKRMAYAKSNPSYSKNKSQVMQRAKEINKAKIKPLGGNNAKNTKPLSSAEKAKIKAKAERQKKKVPAVNGSSKSKLNSLNNKSSKNSLPVANKKPSKTFNLSKKSNAPYKSKSSTARKSSYKKPVKRKPAPKKKSRPARKKK